MSLFQHLSAWTLRALALWCVIEFGAAAYEKAAEASATLVQLSGHDAAMIRLAEHARTAAAQADALEARASAAAPRATLRGSSPTAVAAGLRQQLIELGAQAPVVDAADGSASSRDATRPLTFTATWREPRISAPQILYSLATRYPDLGVTRLTLEAHGDLVEVTAQFTAAFAPVASVQP